MKALELQYLKAALAGPRDVTFAPRALRMLPALVNDLQRGQAEVEFLKNANRNLAAHQIIDEGHRQLVLMAIAHMAVENPGWEWTLGELAEQLEGRPMFDSFLEMKRAREAGQ